jgi:hypothetical protein
MGMLGKEDDPMATSFSEPAAYFCVACQEGWSFRTAAEEEHAAAATYAHQCPAEAGGSGWVVDLLRKPPSLERPR